MNVKEAVDRGVKFLDFFCPGWKDKINVNSIDIARADRCILGQLFGSYLRSPMPTDQDYYYGFAANSTRENYKKIENELTDEWKSRLIQTFDLSTDVVEPGEYVVLETKNTEIKIGDVVKVLKGKHNGLERFRNDNLVMHGLQLFIAPYIIVTPKKG